MTALTTEEQLYADLPVCNTADPAQLESCKPCSELGRHCVKCGADDWRKRGDGTFCCRPCRRSYVSAWYAHNREKILATRREEYRADPIPKREAANRYRAEYPEKCKAKKAAVYRKNPEKCKARVAAWVKKNQSRALLNRSRWGKRNKAKRLVEVENRRAMKRAAPGRGVSAADWRSVVAASLGVCSYCNERKSLTMDHVEPLWLGGAHDSENIVAACLGCNSSKNKNPLLLWIAKRQLRRAA